MANGFTINSVFIGGNLTRDPEVRHTGNGTVVAKLGIAVNNRVKKGNDWVDDPCFVDVTFFGKRAEWIGENLDRGMPVFVEGRLQFRSWEGQDGSKHSKLEVIGDIIKTFVKEGAGGSGRTVGGDDDDEYGEHPARGRKVDRSSTHDDDVPF
jgi:single-strand DNA-binding protein